METTSVGIDVSKADLDVYVVPSKVRFRVANNEAGAKELIGRLTQFKDAIVVLEATGGLESYPAAALGLRDSGSRSSIRAKSGISLGQWAVSRRPTASMRRSSRCLVLVFTLSRVRCPMRRFVACKL